MISRLPRVSPLTVLFIGLCALFLTPATWAAEPIGQPVLTDEATPSDTITYSNAVFLPMTTTQEKYPPDNRAFELELLRLINNYRAANGLAALIEDTSLTLAARRHAQDMAEHKLISHVGADGSTPAIRVAEEGYHGGYAGEVATGGQSLPQDALTGMLSSERHRALILSTTATVFGVGQASNENWLYGSAWVVDFGTS